MSKKHKHRTAVAPSLTEIKSRARRAIHESRYQQALELAKQVYKAEPTPEHAALLRQTYLGRARQLRSQRYARDAATVLQVALQVGDGEPAWLEQVAEELAACGEVRQALAILRTIPASQAQSRVLGQAVDAALQQGAGGRALLPEEYQPDFDCVLQAFSQLEAGQDEPARDTLQAIGLRSPFLEWKLLLRGLMAYYQQDDARALENWQRLTPERLPARLAAPLRFVIDAAYRTAQPPEAQAALQKQADRLCGSPVLQQLRAIPPAISEDSLARAFRLVEAAVPGVRAEGPHLLPRLARCFYSIIITDGQPEDIPRYRRVFGEPADDPQFHRLSAVGFERRHEFESAHHHWQLYEKEVAAIPNLWPPAQADRVRALIWCHMGENAASVPDPDKIPNLPDFLREHPDRPKPLVPRAETCFQHSLKLVPDLLEAHEALFHYLRNEKRDEEARQAGLQLLEHFPDHVHTLKELGSICLRLHEPAEALKMLQRALQVNPLDRRLREEVSTAHLHVARQHAEAGRFEEARGEYQAVVVMNEGKPDATLKGKWAACEFKAGNSARAEELLQEAQATASCRLEIAFNMVIEVIRLKLPRKLKLRFEQDFKEALAEPPTGAGASAIAKTAAIHRAAEVSFRGQKTLEKKVLAYVDKARKAQFTEPELEDVCTALAGMEAMKSLLTFAKMGQCRFPNSPFFPYFEALCLMAKGPGRCREWEVRPLLENAASLARAIPQNDRVKELLEDIQLREKALELISPNFMNMLEGFLGGAGFDFDDFDGEDDDDDDGW